MNLVDILSAERVFLKQRYGSKAQLLHDLARRAGAALQLPAAPIEAALAHREALGSTGVGGGVAMPHAYLAEVAQPFGLFMALRPALAFEAIDERPVDLVLLLLLPSSRQERAIDALASGARRLRDAATLKLLRAAETAVTAHAVLTG